MIALTTNPADWALAVVIGIPLLIAGVSWLAVKAEARRTVADHHHLYPLGVDDQAHHIRRERKSAADLDLSNAQALAEHTARAVRLLRDEIQRIEDEAADRLHHAEWQAGRDGA